MVAPDHFDRATDRSAFLSCSVSPWCTAAFASAIICSPLYAAPQGEQVVAGSAEFARQGDLTQITASHNAIIDYASFNIATQETVRFIQPSETARVLNRIKGADPTQINGSLISNGRVYIVNPYGVYFGNQAIVDVAGIYAAAAQITNADFLNNIDRFTNITGDVINLGTIQSDSVSLIGKHVANHGSIVTDKGMVMMVAGDDVLIGQRDGHIMVKIDAPPDASSTDANDGDTAAGESVNAELPGSPDVPGVENTGTIRARRVRMGAGDIYSLAIRQSGSGSVTARQIEVDGGATGVVEIAGSLDASDRSEGGVGGTVEVLGDKVALVGASVDASGDSDGGTVLIGGDFKGQGDTRTASRTFVGPNSTIKADAGSVGHGGEVIVWSDGVTGFYGQISARGGELWGDGGFVETSGKGGLSLVGGGVDTSTNLGLAGTWLLDPTDAVIFLPTLAAAETNTLPVLFATPDIGADFNLTIDVNAINGAADGSTVVIQATRDVFFNAAVSSAAHLVAQAGRSVVVNADITLTDANIHLESNSPHTAPDAGGSVGIFNSADVSTGGGDITIIGEDFSLVGTINASGGVVSIARTSSARLGIGSSTTNPWIDDLEIARISNVDLWTIGRATTAGSDGLGTGAITLTAAGIDIGGGMDGMDFSRTSDVTLVSTGTIEDTGPVTIGGEASFITEVDGGADITIDNAGSSFGSISAGSFDSGGMSGGMAAAGNITIVAGSDAVINNVVTDGNATFVSDTGAIVYTSATGDFEIGGTAQFTTNAAGGAGAVVITGSNINLGGSVAFTTNGAGADVLLDAGAADVSLGLSSVGGDLQVVDATDATQPGAGAITVDGKLTVAGDVDLNAGGNLMINAAIDPPTLDLMSADDITIGAALAADNQITITAGTDGTGSVTFNAAGRVTTTNGVGMLAVETDSNIAITAGATAGIIDLSNGAVNAGSGTARVTLTADGGSITPDGGGPMTEIDVSGELILQTPAIGGNTLATENVTSLTVIDTGPGDISISEETGSTIANTSIEVGGIGHGEINIAYVDGTVGSNPDAVDINDNLFLNLIRFEDDAHDFTFRYTGTDNSPITLTDRLPTTGVRLSSGPVRRSNVTIIHEGIGGQIRLGNAAIQGGAENQGTVRLVATAGSIVSLASSDTEHIRFGLTTSTGDGGAVILEAASIGTSVDESFEVFRPSRLEIIDTGAGDIFVEEVSRSSITNTSIDVRGDTFGTIDINYVAGTDIVDIDSGLEFTNIEISSANHSFSFTGTGGPIEQTGPIVIAGPVLIRSQDDQDITLDNMDGGMALMPSNALSGPVAFDTGGNVVFDNAATPVVFGSVMARDDMGVLTDFNTDVGGSLTVSTAGESGGNSISDAAPVNVGGDTVLTVTHPTGAIELNDETSVYGGGITATAAGAMMMGGDITLSTNGPMVLNRINTAGSGTFVSRASGGLSAGISDADELTINGTATFDTRQDGGAAIVLDEAGSTFGVINARTLNGAGDALDGSGFAGNVIDISEAGNISLGAVDTTGSAAFTAQGLIDVTTAITSVSDLTLTAGSDADDNINVNAGISATNSVSLNAPMGAITGGSLVTAGAVIDLTANTNISSDGMDAGPLSTATGALTVSVTTGNAVIDNGQALSLGVSNVGGDLTIDADNAINITGTVTATGALNLTAHAGAVTATPVQTVTAASVSVSADGTNGGITLEGLNTAGVVSLDTSGDAVVTNTNAAGLNLGASMIDEDLTATARGPITDDGALTVGGEAQFITELTGGAAITIDAEDAAMNPLAHSFGSVSAGSFNDSGFAGGVVDAGEVTIVESDGMVINNIVTTNNGTFVSDTGTISYTSGTGDFEIGGTADFTTNTAGQAITITGSNVAITGEARFNTNGAGADVALDAGAMGVTLGVSDIGGDLRVVDGMNPALPGAAAITIDGELTVDGDVDLIATNDVTINAPIDPSTPNPTGTVSIASTGGSISGTATVTGGTIDLDAVTGIAATIDAAAVSADNTGLANVDITDVSNTDTTVSSLSTFGHTRNVVPGGIDPDDPADRGISVNKTGSGSLLITGDISSGNPVEDGGGVNITAADGGITIAPAVTISTGVAGSSFNGGDIDIEASQGTVRVEAGVVFDTRDGAGGTHNLPALGVDADPTVLPGIQLGAGDVRLLGDGLDLFINSTVSEATSIEFEAPRNIFVRALIETTNPADGNVTLLADEDPGMEAPNLGGVIFEGAGAINAMGDVTIRGSDFSETVGPNEIDAVVFSGSGVDRVTAMGDVSVALQGTAPMGAVFDVGGNITGGAVTFAGPVRLIDNPTITSTGGDVTFASTVDSDAGVRNLTVDAAGTNIFAAEVGGGSPLGMITTSGGVTQIAADVTGLVIDFQDAVEIDHSSVTIEGSTSVDFDSTVSSATAGNNLTVNSPSTTFAGVVGGGPEAIGALMTDSAGTTRIAANITANDVQLGDAVVVTGGLGNTAVTVAGNNSVTFASTVDGDQNGMNSLTVNSPTTSFDGDVGNAGDAMAMTPTRLNNLVTDLNGTTTISGTTIRTVGDQRYNDTVVFSPAGGAITLDAGVAVNLNHASGADQLTINAGGGVTINQGVTANDQIVVSAGTDGDGSVDVTSSGSLMTTNPGGAITLNAGATGQANPAAGDVVVQVSISTQDAATNPTGSVAINAVDQVWGGGTITGANISLTAGVGIDADGSGTGALDLATAASTMTVNVPGGSAAIGNTGALAINASTAGVGLRITADDITVQGPLTAGGVVDLHALAGNVDVGQQVTGGTVALTSSDRLLGSATVTGSSVTLTSVNGIDSDGAGGGSFTTDAGTLSVNSDTNNASVTNITAVSLGTSRVAGDLVIDSPESIDVVGFVTAGDLISLTAGTSGDGSVNINVGGSLANTNIEGDITLTSGNSSGDIIVDGDVTANDVATLDAPAGRIFGTATVAGDALDLDALTAIHRNVDGSGALLTNAGQIAIDVTVAGASIRNAAAVALGVSGIGGNLSVTATTGGITNNPGETITVGGDASFATDETDADINLDDLSVDGTLSLATTGSGGDAVVVNDSMVALGNSTVRGDLDVTANMGGITDAVGSTVVVDGEARFEVQQNNETIVLDSTDADAIAVQTSGPNANVMIDNIAVGGDVRLNSSTVGGTLTAISSGNFHVNAGQSVTAGSSIAVMAGENSGAGGVVLESGSQLATSAAGSTIAISTGVTTGNIEVNGTLAARDAAMDRTGMVTLNAPNGQILGTGTTSGNTLDLTAGNGIAGDDMGGGSFAIDTSTVTIASTSGGASVTNAATIELDGVDVAGALSVTATTGDVIFDDDPATPEVDEISADGSATLSAPMGAVTGTAIVESPVVAFNAQDGINDGSGGPVNTESLHISADNAGIGDVRILNSNMDVLTETNVASLSTGSGAIHFNQTGDAATRITGDIITGSGTIDIVAAADITIDPGLGEASTIRSGGTGVDGGNITITSGNSLVFGSGANTSITLDTRDGVDGEFILNPGVTLGNLQREVGAGDITLAGTGFEDLIVDGNLTDDTPFTLSAPGDIIITALIETTNAAAGNIELRANNDAQDGGGVVIRGLGRINSAADVSIFGSDLIESASAAGDGVVIDRPGVGEPADRVTAAGGILVELIDDDGVSGERVELGADLLAQGIHSGSRLDPMIAVDASIRLAAPVTLTGPVTVRSAATDPNNHVVFDSTIDAQTGAASTELTVGVETGGQIRFEDHLGSTAPISGLTTGGSGTTVLSGADLTVNTAGDQTYGTSVTLESNATLNGSDDVTITEAALDDGDTDTRSVLTVNAGVDINLGEVRLEEIVLEADDDINIDSDPDPMAVPDSGSPAMVTLMRGGLTATAGGHVMIGEHVSTTNGGVNLTARGDAIPDANPDTDGSISVHDIAVDGGAIELQADSGLGRFGEGVPNGTITINSTLETAGDDVILGMAGRSSVPITATINGGDPSGVASPPAGQRSVTIRTNGGRFIMGSNEKFTVDGSLSIETEGGDAELGDLNTVGNLSVDVGGGDLFIRLRDPVRNLLASGQLAAEDRGVDFVALGSTSDIDFGLNSDIFLIGEGAVPSFAVEGNPGGDRIKLPPFLNGDRRVSRDDIKGTTQPISRITVDVNPTFFVDFQLDELVNIATSIASIVSTDEGEEVTEEVLIAQSQKEKLRQLGIFARDADTEQRVKALLEGTEVIDDIAPSDAAASEHEVTTNRIHSGAATTALTIYSRLYWKTAVDDEGNPKLDDEGNPQLEPQAGQIREAFARALEAYAESGYVFEDPWEFRDYIESVEGAKEALLYADGLRRLFDELRLVGITPKEMRIAKSILIAQSGITPRGMTWQQLDQVIEGRPEDLVSQEPQEDEDLAPIQEELDDESQASGLIRELIGPGA